MAVAFEQLGLTGDDASLGLYSFLTCTIGSVLLEVCQRRSDELLAEQGSEQVEAFTSVTNRPVDAPSISDDTTHPIDRVMTKRGPRPAGG